MFDICNIRNRLRLGILQGCGIRIKRWMDGNVHVLVDSRAEHTPAMLRVEGRKIASSSAKTHSKWCS